MKQIVIEVKDEDYKRLIRGYIDFITLPKEKIINGTLLPNGHGVLKDTSEIIEIAETLESKMIITNGVANIIKDIIQQANVVVNADTEGK